MTHMHTRSLSVHALLFPSSLPFFFPLLVTTNLFFPRVSAESFYQVFRYMHFSSVGSLGLDWGRNSVALARWSGLPCNVYTKVSLQRISYFLLLLPLLSHFSCVRLCATPQTAVHQALPSLGFSRQGHQSGCHFLLRCMKVKSESEVTQSCQTLRESMDCSLPGSSVRGIFQARVLEWGAIAFSELFPRIPYMCAPKHDLVKEG